MLQPTNQPYRFGLPYVSPCEQRFRQALSDSMRAADRARRHAQTIDWIALLGDDCAGVTVEGQFLVINGERIDCRNNENAWAALAVWRDQIKSNEFGVGLFDGADALGTPETMLDRGLMFPGVKR